MALQDQLLVNSRQVKSSHQCVADFARLVDLLVPGLGSCLVRHAEVDNIFASVFQVEAGPLSCHAEVDHHMVICPVLVLADFQIYLLQGFVTAYNIHVYDFGVLQLEVSLVPSVRLEHLTEISDHDAGRVLKD